MQAVPASIPYLTKVLNLNYQDIENVSKLFVELNLDTEKIFLGHVPKNEILFDDPVLTYDTIIKYFQHKGKTYTFSNIEDIDKGKHREIEDFAKLVWLTDEFINSNLTFQFPVGIHWNPRICANVVHPGGTRNQVLRIFGKPKILALYFNTWGINPSWLDQKFVEVSISDIVKMGGDIRYTADHGSIIPHVHFRNYIIPHNVNLYQNKIRNKFASGFSVKTNINDPIFDFLISDNPSVYIEFSVHYTSDDVCKSILLSLLGYTVESENFKIIKNLPSSVKV